ncbi:hypothetical protein, partial [Sinorhizobium fredii]
HRQPMFFQGDQPCMFVKFKWGSYREPDDDNCRAKTAWRMCLRASPSTADRPKIQRQNTAPHR